MQRAHNHDFISGKRTFPIAREGGREVLWLSAVDRFVNSVVYYFELFEMLQQTSLSQYIA